MVSQSEYKSKVLLLNFKLHLLFKIGYVWQLNLDNLTFDNLWIDPLGFYIYYTFGYMILHHHFWAVEFLKPVKLRVKVWVRKSISIKLRVNKTGPRN